ncbi:scoloptoxin SSD14-like [Amblyomma americanum]
METASKPSQESKKQTSDGSHPSALNNPSDVPAPPASKESKHLAHVCVLAVVATVIVIGGVLMVSQGPEEVVEKMVVVTSYTPSSSKLGNYSKWAATTDVAQCAGVSRYMYSKGGNAIDAAVATLLCHGVAIPHTMGIGGGFVATIYLAGKKEVKTLIARETAPSRATEDMFVGKRRASLRGGLSVAVPGELRGYEALVTQFGSKKKFTDHFDYAINASENGYVIEASLDAALRDQAEHLNKSEAMKKLFFRREPRDPLGLGDRLVNKDLAATFRLLKAHGVGQFYIGDIAEKIVDAVNKSRGIITKEDLQKYKVRWADPVVRKFRDGRTMYSVPPPASGAVLAYILGIVDLLREGARDQLEDSPLTYHRFVEALKFAYAKRALLGDQQLEGSVAKVARELVSEEAAKTAGSKITDSQTHDDLSYYGFVDTKKAQGGTSHSCYWDAEGNVVAITSTINYHFGSHVIPEGTGFPLNDEMDDFSTPGRVNVYGFSPSPVNFIKPNKIPQSSMAPTIVLDKDGNPEMCVGGSGGSHITTGVGLVTMRTLWQGKTIKEAIDQARMHHQLMPTELEVETSFPKEYRSMLEKKGHKIKVQEVMPSGVSGIYKRDGVLYANSDFRRGGSVDGV